MLGLNRLSSERYHGPERTGVCALTSWHPFSIGFIEQRPNPKPVGPREAETIHANRWYDVKVELSGARIHGYSNESNSICNAN